MRAFGLTGSIGCGKSTVARLLSEYPDIMVIDCDRIAKEVMENEEYRGRVGDIVGIDITPGVPLDFHLIGSLVFADPKKKKSLEEFVHPLVWAAVEDQVAYTPNKIRIVESAIIFETGSEQHFIATIAVTCKLSEQFRRLIEDRGMKSSSVLERINGQLSSREKAARSQYVINTDCSLEELRQRVDALYRVLKHREVFV